MAPTLGALKWYVIAAALRDAVYVGLDPEPCRYGVVPGSVVWDECDCGALYLTVLRTFLSDTFPEILAAPVGVGCDASQEVAEIVVFVLRCAPSVNAPADLAPTPEALDGSARQLAADMFNTLSAVTGELCRMKEDGDILDFLMQEGTAVGEEGGCVGMELHVLVALPRG
jgi:hypothetical protein